MRESTIIGKWVISNGQIIKDSNCLLIEEMVKTQFEVVKKSLDGWTITYRDIDRGDIWELTYPESHLQGGGPPTLNKLDK